MQQKNQNIIYEQKYNYNIQQPIELHNNSCKLSSQSPIAQFNEKQYFPVIYNNNTFIVDPISLSNSSLKFKEIIKPYINDEKKMKNLQLEIKGNQFTKRNMDNFLKICQNLPTDVQNSELYEICTIAKMFGAHEIYKIGSSFIQSNLDPNYSIPEMHDDSNLMLIIGEKKSFQNDKLLESIDLENIKTASYKCKSNEKYTSLKSDDYLNTGIIDEIGINNENQQQNAKNKRIKKKNSVIYTVKIENNIFKSSIYKFSQNDRILYSAKQKNKEIFIGYGCNVNISQSQNHVARITQHVATQSNTIKVGNASFNCKYNISESSGDVSMIISFPTNNQIMTWTPKPPKYDMTTDKYYLNFHGQYHHKAIRSPKNMVLQNQVGHPTFIVRKMAKNLYELECNHNIDPLIAFTIGLSDIVGPFKDPWSNLDGHII